VLHDPINGTAEEDRGKDTPLTDSRSCCEEGGCSSTRSLKARISSAVDLPGVKPDC